MSNYHNVTQYSPAGEPWSMPGRGTFQTFFLDIEGVDGTVTTNKKEGNTPKLGNTYGDLIDTGKLGKKGQKIYQFKAQLAPEGSTPPQGTGHAPAVDRGTNIPEWFAPYAIMIKAIYANVPGITESNEEHNAVAVDEPVDEPVAGTKMSKAELEDIFGGSLEPINIEE